MNLKEKGLNKNSRICQITHKDMDGAGCTIILQNVFKNLKTFWATYTDIDDIVSKLVNDKDFDFIFITDVCPSKMVSLDYDNVILLDHHGDRLERNRPEKHQYVIQGYSGTLLVKKFIENYFKIKLNHLNDLVYLINDYDLWNLKNSKSTFLNTLFYKYWQNGFVNRFYSGNTRLNKEEIQFLREKRIDYKNIYENLKVFQLESINSAFFETELYINELCHDLLKQYNFDIVIARNLRKKSISFRTAKKTLNLGEILTKFGGGGHGQAGGISFIDIMDAEKKIELFIDTIERINKG